MSATRLRNLAGNALLLAVTTALTLILLEGVLRLTISPAKLVGSHPTNPAIDQWRNELRYWERYHDQPDSELHRYDPRFGWDSSYDAIRARGRTEDPAPARLRAVAVGDSFVFGNEVEAQENFSALLDQADNGLQVLNMGVPGFGIDQSYLKYLHHGARHHPDIVLFGIFTSDYQRSTVGFTTFAKPFYRVEDGQLVLTNQPVPEPLAELERITGALDGRWYLAEYLNNLRSKLTGRSTRAAFFDTTDTIVRHILSELINGLDPGQRVLVLHIPRGETFTDHDASDREIHERLLRIYDALEIEYIDLAQVFLSDLSAEQIANRYYVVREGGSIGHLNPAGHRRVAAVIAARLDL